MGYERRVDYLRRMLTNELWLKKNLASIPRIAKLADVGERWLYITVQGKNKTSCSDRVDQVVHCIEQLSSGEIEMPEEYITNRGRPAGRFVPSGEAI